MSARPSQVPLFTAAGRPWSLEAETIELRLRVIRELARHFHLFWNDGKPLEIDEPCERCGTRPVIVLAVATGHATAACPNLECGWFENLGRLTADDGDKAEGEAC